MVFTDTYCCDEAGLPWTPFRTRVVSNLLARGWDWCGKDLGKNFLCRENAEAEVAKARAEAIRP